MINFSVTNWVSRIVKVVIYFETPNNKLIRKFTRVYDFGPSDHRYPRPLLKKMTLF